MTTLTTLLAGVVFGLALAAPPGPMNAIIAEESVVRGWLAGFKAGLGAATADFVFFLLAYVGLVAVVAEVTVLKGTMVFVGGLLMLYFAYGAATDAQATFTDSADVEEESKGFRKAFVLALTNPYQILFWLTVGVGLLEPGSVDVLSYASDALAGALVVETGSPALLVGLFGGVGVWITGFPAALNAARRRMDALAPAVAYASAAVLAGFGVYFLYDAVVTVAPAVREALAALA
ncbi:LysE family translocator [Halorarius halobius]|uniref:LysE family translocator n=1 Tax=Halorarius halobius TaxID=2962671 RepID=UPI003313EDDF